MAAWTVNLDRTDLTLLREDEQDDYGSGSAITGWWPNGDYKRRRDDAGQQWRGMADGAPDAIVGYDAVKASQRSTIA